MNFENIFEVAITVSDVVSTALRLIDDSERRGGFFGLTIKGQDICVPIGDIPDKKRLKYYTLAREKIRQLESHPLHRTSHQSRDPDAIVEEMAWGKWGGGIRTDNGNLLSFSGLPELWDEAVVFVVAIKHGWLEKTSVLRRISRKRNPHLRRLIIACRL